MKKYVLLVDIEKCSQCYNCVLACKDEHFGNDFPPLSFGCQELGQKWIDMKIVERGVGEKVRVDCWPELCRHCDDPECVKASKAVYKRGDDIVIIDPYEAKGQKALLESCPHGAISWNEERSLPQKCTLCAHLLDEEEPMPRCVEACPTSALSFGDLNDPASEVARIVSENPELGGQNCAVRYYNRPGRFATGSVYLSEAEVAEGATVILTEGDKVVAQTLTNGFGDFRFDRLPEDKRYRIQISLDGHAPLQLDLDTSSDVCFEDILLA